MLLQFIFRPAAAALSEAAEQLRREEDVSAMFDFRWNTPAFIGVSCVLASLPRPDINVNHPDSLLRSLSFLRWINISNIDSKNMLFRINRHECVFLRGSRPGRCYAV